MVDKIQSRLHDTCNHASQLILNQETALFHVFANWVFKQDLPIQQEIYTKQNITICNVDVKQTERTNQLKNKYFRLRKKHLNSNMGIIQFFWKYRSKTNIGFIRIIGQLESLVMPT